MLIRAVQSSDDDSDGDASLAPPSSSDADASGLSASSAVKLAWLGASLALVALLLLDLAALLNQFLPGSEPSRDATDPFTVVSWALLLWRRQAVGTAQPATVLNNLVGQVFVAAWIFSRESALAAQRQRSSTRTRSGPLAMPGCIKRRLPWVLVAVVMCVGHVASCAYILFALFESHGAGGARGSGSARTKFWLGRSSSGSRTAPRV